MTIDEAKAILRMCTDIKTSLNGDIYINRQYVINILDMIEGKGKKETKDIQENLPKEDLNSNNEVHRLREEDVPVAQQSPKTVIGGFGPFTSNSSVKENT